MDIRKRAEELESEVIELRRWLHQHAELSWQEFETTEHYRQRRPLHCRYR